MVNNLTRPPVLSKPFASQGDKTTLPVDATGTQAASLQEGFPIITSTPITQGGIPPQRTDFNGLGFLTTSHNYYAQNGGTFTFDQSVSDAIGGYPEGAVLWGTQGDSPILVKSLIGNNTFNFVTNPEYLDEEHWSVLSFGGGGLEIGDIGFAPLGIDEVQNKRRYLNGQVISQSQFVSFTNKVKAAIQLYPSLATSETNWQATVTNSKLGQCGKFVIDDNAGTIRLPKVVNIQGLQDLALMGSIKAESLPNITGETGGWVGGGISGDNGALYTVVKGNQSWGGAISSGVRSVAVDASRSSSTYQDNAPVQQEAVQYPYFIQVATGTEESVDVITEIELNNPFSLLDYKWSEYEITNASWLLSNGAFHSGATYVAVYELLLEIYNGTFTKDGVSVKLSTEEYTDTDFVINTADTTFRLPIKVKLASGNAVVGNGMTLGLSGYNNYYYGLSTIDPDGTENNALALGVSSYGASLPSNGNPTISGSAHTNIGITNDPLKSGIETSSNGLKLYFYVGETIQDANIIVASNALTEIANLKAHSIVETYVNGTSWYRVYSDGWCEQGGATSVGASAPITVTLLKEYRNNLYSVQITINGTASSPNSNTYPYQALGKTASSFIVANYNSGPADNNYYQWQACGYIS